MNADKRRLFSLLKGFDFPLRNSAYSAVKAFDFAFDFAFSELRSQP